VEHSKQCVSVSRHWNPPQSIYSSILFIHAHKSLLSALDMLPLGFVRVYGGLSARQCQYPFPQTLASRFRGQSRVTISGGASTPTAVTLSCSSITSLSFSTRAQNRLMAVNFFGGEVRLALYETCKSLTRKQNTEHLTNRKPATSIG
jgi:hypothetical protein